MGFLDRLFGRSQEPESQPQPQPAPGSGYGTGNYGGGYNQQGQPQQLTDQQAIERYRYMLRTAPPETLEQAHAEAFAQLTPEQRRMALQQLSANLPASERGAQYGDDPQSLARMATRAELRQPGTLERTFSSMPGQGMSMGGMMAGSFMSTIAGVLVGSAIANAFFGGGGYDQGYAEGQQDANAQDAGGQDAGQDADMGGGGDYADYGGGDFGGGDFGGGDFGGDF